MSLSSPSDPLSYAQPNGVQYVVRSFSPNSNNISFPLPCIWLNTAAKQVFILVSKANNTAQWVLMATSNDFVASVVTDSGIAYPINSILQMLGNNTQGVITSANDEEITISIVDASESDKGVMAIASAAEMQAGTVANKAVVPSLLGPYSAGTFTPQIGGSVSTSGVSYSTQSGYYVRHGNLVTIYGLVTWTSIGTSSGTLRLQNLPFAVSPTPGFPLTFNAALSGVTLDANYTQVFGAFLTAQTYADINEAGSGETVANAPLTATGSLFFSGQYLI
jgi:hypothetical protein